MTDKPTPKSGEVTPLAKEPVAAFQNMTQWLARTIAITGVMVGPGMLGYFLDSRFKTQYLAIVGFAFGMFLGTATLLVMAKMFIPPARGRALEDADGDSQEKSSQDVVRDE